MHTGSTYLALENSALKARILELESQLAALGKVEAVYKSINSMLDDVRLKGHRITVAVECWTGATESVRGFGPTYEEAVESLQRMLEPK